MEQKAASLNQLIKTQNKEKVLQILDMPEARDILKV